MAEWGREERVRENERRIHRGNDIIARTAADWSGGAAGDRATAEFFCACGRPECNAVIVMRVSEYEQVHREPDRYIVTPGHENPSIERVVEDHGFYRVVEKLPET